METLGWVGAGLLLSAFFYLTIFKKQGDNLFYLLGNLFGSIGLLINAWYNDAFPFVLVNSFWVVITVISLIKKTRATAV
ncbi:MAG: hypothetical protein RIF46_11685 [Cyclobacteriaceae bacterium]